MGTIKQKLVQLFEKLEIEIGSQPTKKQWAKHIRIPSDMIIRNNFGNWTCFLQSMGKNIPHNNHQTTHNYSRTKVYDQWSRIKSRCKNPKATLYPKYGAKGISVCERWEKFENFLEDMGMPTGNKTSIDRIDPNKGYFKDNCRWATKFEQGSENKTNLRTYTLDGKTKCIRAWERELGYKYGTLARRLRKYSFKEAIEMGLPHLPRSERTF